MTHHNKLIIHTPISALSLGQFGYNVIRELYRRKVQCVIFPYGNVDLTPYKPDQQFNQWLERSINDRLKRYDRTVPCLNLWHINGSEMKPADRQYTFSFHETSSPTDYEINVVNQQDATFFSSSWTVENFQLFGAKNVSFIPLGLDEDFVPITQPPYDFTHWGLVGKVELRKNTQMIVQTWIKRYGGNPKHQLTLCVTNPFFNEQQMNGWYAQTFGAAGKPFNVNILPHLKTNVEMNRLYNALDVDIGFSSSEGWNLPSFTATALGKWSIVTNCTAHKDWATTANSILVEPTLPMREVYDGVFFGKGQPFSQGNVYDFSVEQLNEAMDRAERKAKTPNLEGRKLATTMTYKNTVDQILAKIPIT